MEEYGNIKHTSFFVGAIAEREDEQGIFPHSSPENEYCLASKGMQEEAKGLTHSNAVKPVFYCPKGVVSMDNLTPAEKARQGRNHYEREKRKADPAKREREKAAQQRYWAKYFDENLKPALDAKVYGKTEENK